MTKFREGSQAYRLGFYDGKCLDVGGGWNGGWG